MFFNELNSQKTNNKDEDYNDTYKSLAGDDRYTPPPKSLHNAIQYRNKSQKPLYKDKSEESPTNKKQYLIEENMIENLLHDFDDLDIIMLRLIAIDTHRIKKAKKSLRRNKRITRPMIKATEAAKASAVHMITRMLQRQSLMFMIKSYNITPEQIYRKSIIYKRAICFTDVTFWQ